MNNTRTFNPIVVLSLAAGAFLLLSIGFIAGTNLPEVSINFGELSLSQVVRPEPVARYTSEMTAEGLVIYHQSERDLALSQANLEGMTVYHESEWGNPTTARIKQAGLETYWQSERNSPVSDLNEQSLSSYWQSERNIPLTASGSTDEGMDIYFASERDR